ncbi:hypothetical protein [Desulfovibrio piger]|jgi:hypothetical protein|uniref:hypothetical protein n=1 Tax=Desulfovibrio piger TaxID=901 RepID=UPI0026EF5AD7|nr:hypothetical protein [Desulfovibrio piger]
MYVDTETILTLAKLITALGTIAGICVAVYKFVERDKQQVAKIQAIQKEQTLICYGVLACLKGLKEQGCNGPVTDALDKIEKHLNQAAHEDLTA